MVRKELRWTYMRLFLRITLGAFLVFAGISHFRDPVSFLAQVPPFFPMREFIIQFSGVIEILLGSALVSLSRYQAKIGIVAACFFIIIFPGNISQFVTRTSAFGLDTDLSRAIRLLFQPVLVMWAMWSTNAWSQLPWKRNK
jgi:uncharacterized membrane protein